MTTCPRCGAQATGNFCSSCGAALSARPCPTCGGTPEPGARFCNHCGAALGAMGGAAPAGAAGRGAERPGGPGSARSRGASAAQAGGDGPPSRVAWWVAAAFVVGLAVILALPIIRRDPSAGVPPGGAAPFAGSGSGGTPPDLSTMTPRQAADRLFDRVMRADAAGNAAEAQQFMPMALQAHEMAQPLDLDGRYHFAVLHQTAENYETAMDVARSILDEAPDHLLGLAVAADVSRALGDSTAAVGYYERFLEAYDTEMASGRLEYLDHGLALGIARDIAVAATGP